MDNWGELDEVLAKLPPLSPKQREAAAKHAETPLVNPVPLQEGSDE